MSSYKPYENYRLSSIIPILLANEGQFSAQWCLLFTELLMCIYIFQGTSKISCPLFTTAARSRPHQSADWTFLASGFCCYIHKHQPPSGRKISMLQNTPFYTKHKSVLLRFLYSVSACHISLRLTRPRQVPVVV
jgi:hypothetical protein